MNQKLVFFLVLFFAGIKLATAQLEIKEVRNMGAAINTSFSEYAPVLNSTSTVLYVTSRRTTDSIVIKKKKPINENIYESTFNEETKMFDKLKYISYGLNSDVDNISAVSMSADNKKMIVYKDDENGNGDIYQCLLDGEQWQKPNPFPDPINTEEHHESSLVFTPDGNGIYFISDRPDYNIGKRDIWYCEKKNQASWGSPVNLGGIINTSSDEEGLFLSKDGNTLYFASKGHGGMGGYDIFYTKKNNGSWGKPVALPAPINSVADDFLFVLNNDESRGYFTSNREGGFGDNDIYEVVFVQQNVPLASIEKTTNDPKLESIAQVEDPTKSNVLNENKVELNNNVVDNSNKQTQQTIELKNVYFDFNSSDLKKESFTALNKLVGFLEKNSSTEIEIHGHTDNIGSDEYNQKLSLARAESIKKYLESKGVSANRLKPQGYGATQPKATNTTEAGRHKNRRVEIKIL